MNFFRKIFNKDPKEFFLSFNPAESKFNSVSWNWDLTRASHRQWQIETKNPDQIILWTKTPEEKLQFKGSRKGAFVRLPADARDLMNLAIHTTLQVSMERHREFMLSPVSGATTMDFQSETRALQWIQASFGTLERALSHMQGERDLLLTAAFFSGTEPDSRNEEQVIRLIAFNLDIIFRLLPDQSMQVIVFNDKDQGTGSSKAPALQQIIKVTKPQFYDEMMKLVHKVATVGELK